MEKPGKNLTPTRTGECMYRLIKGRERLAHAKESLIKAGGEYKPDAEDIRAAELLDNLPFLKILSFEFGGYFGGYRTYTVEAIDSSLPGGMFKYCIDDEKVGKKLPDPSLIQNPTKTPLVIKNLEDLADYLKEIHLEEWMPEYWPDRFGVAVCDGTQWHLKRFYNKCWGSEAARLSYTNIYYRTKYKAGRCLGVSCRKRRASAHENAPCHEAGCICTRISVPLIN